MRRFGLTWQRVLVALGAIGSVAAVALFGGGWYYSNEIRDGALRVEHEPPEFDLEVAAAGDGTVTLAHPGGDGVWSEAGLWGLEWAGGYARVGRILATGDGTVTRELTPITGTPAPGEAARLDRAAFPENPLAAHGLAYEDVTFTSPVGELGAWLLDGPEDVWVVYVHGRGSSRNEALRALPVAAGLGFHSLVIDYRNDEGAPPDPSGEHRFGRTEWRDVEAAVRYAIDNGAESVVLFGYSMGGGLAVNFLLESALAGRVAGTILDAPLLSLGAAVDLSGEERGLPGILTETAKFITAQRFGVDWTALDLVRRSDELSSPILLFHGDGDTKVPVRTSDALARARPDLVRYVRVVDAEHVGAWNRDPGSYEAEVEGFLAAVTRP